MDFHVYFSTVKTIMMKKTEWIDEHMKIAYRQEMGGFLVFFQNKNICNTVVFFTYMLDFPWRCVVC